MVSIHTYDHAKSTFIYLLYYFQKAASSVLFHVKWSSTNIIQPLSVITMFRVIILNWTLPLTYRPSTAQKAMNTTTLVATNTIFRCSPLFLWLLIKLKKKMNKRYTLIYHIHDNSKWKLFSQKEARFADILIFVFI